MTADSDTREAQMNATHAEKWAHGIDLTEMDWSAVAAWLAEVPQPYRSNRAEMALHDAMAEIQRLREVPA